MCGIVVGLAFGKLNKRDEDVRQRLLRYFTTELLIATEERGKDATGAAVLFEDGNFVGIKRGERVADYLAAFGETKEYYGGFLKTWREHEANAKVFLGHCRAATLGDKCDNENNHPIKIGNLVGIHNGKIENHDEIFKNLKCSRDGKVDSEAIFRLLDHYTNQGKEPFTLKAIQNIVNRLDGPFAVAAFNADNIEQVPVFRDGRPMEFVLIRPLGILLIISEKKFWTRLHFRYERIAYYYREIAGIKLPKFLGEEDIVEESLLDDHAIIFDLSAKVTKDTKIEDLGEKEKMVRTNKVWQKSTYTTTTSRTPVARVKTSYRGVGSNTNASENKDKDKENKSKHWVFDKIKKHYVAKEGDVELKAEESTTLPVDADTSPDKPKVNVIDNRKFKRSVSEDDGKTEGTSVPVEVEDITNYKSNDNQDVIDMSPEDVTVVKSSEEEPAIIEVMMTNFPTEAVSAANKAIKNLPDDKKGYADMDEMLTDIDINDEARANTVGMLIVANRVAQSKFKQGFMAGYAVRMKDEKSIAKDDKASKREKHIAMLKSIILILSKFYAKSKMLGNDTFNETVKRKLAQIVLDDNKKIDVQEILALFNSFEKATVREVSQVISEASQYKE